MSEVGFIPRETIHKIKMELVQGVVNCRRGKKYSPCYQDRPVLYSGRNYFSFNFFSLENAMAVSSLNFLPCLSNGGGGNRESGYTQQLNYRRILINSVYIGIGWILVIGVWTSIVDFMKFQFRVMFGLFACPIMDTIENTDIRHLHCWRYNALTLLPNEKHTTVKQICTPLVGHPQVLSPNPWSYGVTWPSMAYRL